MNEHKRNATEWFSEEAESAGGAPEITGNARSWAQVAEQLDGFRLVLPALRSLRIGTSGT